MAAVAHAPVVAAALALAAAVDEARGVLPDWQDGLVVAITAVTLGRAIFVALIEERNNVLAKNIRDACLRGADDGDATSTEAAVVAVMGMAHLEGVRMALLRDEFVRDESLRDFEA